MNIHVHRYPVPTTAERAAVDPGCGFPADTWQGWIEDAVQQIPVDGRSP